MEIPGKILQKLPEQSGKSANGSWKKQEFIVETGGQYPKKVCITVWNDKVPIPEPGSDVKVAVDVESREYNGRWYTDLKAFRIDVVSAAGPSADHEAYTNAEQFPGYDQADENPAEDDLPF